MATVGGGSWAVFTVTGTDIGGMPDLETLICVLPSPLAVTKPDELTVATFGLPVTKTLPLVKTVELPSL